MRTQSFRDTDEDKNHNLQFCTDFKPVQAIIYISTKILNIDVMYFKIFLSLLTTNHGQV